MTSAQRITLNALATYSRTLLAMGLGLFSSRWLLAALGVVDYGLMGVVGGLIGCVVFLNGVSSYSCARFFALSIGKGDSEETNRWFNTALSIHTVLPAVLVLVGWPVGEWLLGHFLNIPSARLGTARWVFRLSLVSAWCAMAATPYLGMFTAKQRIAEMSVWNIVQTIASFSLVWFLTTYRGDAWLFYSFGMVVLSVAVTGAQVFRARHLFVECRIRFGFWYQANRMKEVVAFAGWQLFGAGSSLARGSLIGILLNKFFPPRQFPEVNASYGIGNNLSGYTATFSSALLGAFTPEITAAEGAGQRERMLRLANRVSKLSFMLVVLFAVPLFIEADYVLKLWLVAPPMHAATFCRFFLVALLCEQISYGHMVAVNAAGRIAVYQMVTGGILLLTFPLAWMLLALGQPATSITWAFVAMSLLATISRILFGKKMLNASPVIWFRAVAWPCLLLLIATGSIGMASVFSNSTASSARFLLTLSLCTMAWLITGWVAVLDHNERGFILHFGRSLFHII